MEPVIECCKQCGKIKSATWHNPHANAAAAPATPLYYINPNTAAAPATPLYYINPNTAAAPQVLIPYELPRVHSTQSISSADMCWCR